MFQFPGFASAPYVFRYGYPCKQSGFPHSEIPGFECLFVSYAGAYRRLPRPSSPSAAKVSTVCAYLFDHITSSNLKATPRLTAGVRHTITPLLFDTVFSTSHFKKPLHGIYPWPGGAREDRTPDLLHAKQALSQLSYGPLALTAFCI